MSSPLSPSLVQRRRLLQGGAAAVGLLCAPAVCADDVLLLTKRPTQVAEILRYVDAWPRTVEKLSEASFMAMKKRSLDVLQREVRR